MRKTGLITAVLLSLTIAACKKTTTAPSQTSTVSTTVATTSASTTVATTTAQRTSFTVNGVVTDDKNQTPLRFADIEIIQGANIGRRFQGDANGNYTMPNLSAGAFVARFWAQGYLIRDVLITITNNDVRQDVQLTLAPVTTTAAPGTTGPAHAEFFSFPNPCTIDNGPTINCSVDGSGSSGSNIRFHWAYAGKDVFDVPALALSFGCGNLLGTGATVTLSVRLTITDDAGNADSIDQGVPVTKLNGVCP